jgi:hypothetical protein
LLIYSPVSVQSKKGILQACRAFDARGADPQRAVKVLWARGAARNSVFIRGALFSAEPENIVVKADYL